MAYIDTIVGQASIPEGRSTTIRPRLRMVRAMWTCGLLIEPGYCWTVATTWQEALSLWLRVQDRKPCGRSG